MEPLGEGVDEFVDEFVGDVVGLAGGGCLFGLGRKGVVAVDEIVDSGVSAGVPLIPGGRWRW